MSKMEILSLDEAYLEKSHKYLRREGSKGNWTYIYKEPGEPGVRTRVSKNHALEEGYYFHGAYSHDLEEMKQRAAELRFQGHKAVVVNEPPSPLSRGHHGMGYSVYWIESEESKQKKHQDELLKRKKELIDERDKLKARLAEIDLELG